MNEIALNEPGEVLNDDISYFLDCTEDEATKTSLMYTKHMKIEVKDVYNEVRALKEVERFLNNPTVLLNIQENQLDDIIEAMLNKLIANNDGSPSVTRDPGNREIRRKWLGRDAKLANSNKMTKSSLETGRTFATILSDMEIRQQLIASESETEFLDVLFKCKESMRSGEYQRSKKFVVAAKKSSFIQPSQDVTPQPSNLYYSINLPSPSKDKSQFAFGRGITDDVKRRWPHYSSDFSDGVTGHRTAHKLVSTVMFLYFACLLPSIAFGVLNSKNTNGKIGVKQVIIAQSVSGVLYSLFSGQPLIVLLTTAPLALYVKVMHDICDDMNLDFYAMYTMTGLWNTLFLILYSVFGASYIMRWSTRSINEIFALFISVAFAVASLQSIFKEYNKPDCHGIQFYNNKTNVTNNCQGVDNEECFCSREGGTLYILLSCGCVLTGVTLYNFKKR
ncbi:hypothetical protein QZH41_016075 [Actinostola sp. cb2023]|nr:hypothetical protein QZH41_016075 [Actinostola sp. cb2023]